jgi:hypothetical protein
MATFASRMIDLTAAIAAAINARAPKVGASAYDLAVINGYTGTQTQWLRGSAAREMTSAQRVALTGSDLWDRRRITDTDTGNTWIYSSAGGYWFNASSQVILTRGSGQSQVAISSQVVTAVPLETLLAHEGGAGNIYTPTTGATPSVKINRGGMYHVKGVILYTASDSNYVGALILDAANGTPGPSIREGNQITNNSRIQIDADIRVVEGASQTFRLGVYTLSTTGKIDSAGGITNTYFSVTRVGD